MTKNNKHATKSFQEKLLELEELLTWFESDEVTLEDAVSKYEYAQKLSSELEDELMSARNKIEVIKKKFTT